MRAFSCVWCSQVVSFKSSPQIVHSPLQSGRQRGLIGTSIIKYSRTMGSRSIVASSGKIRPDSVTERGLKAYNSLKSAWSGCMKSIRQRTHCDFISPLNVPCTSSPCGVRVTRATPESRWISKSDFREIFGNSKEKSRR